MSACLGRPNDAQQHPPDNTGPLIVQMVQHDVSSMPLSETPAAPRKEGDDEADGDGPVHIPHPAGPMMADPVVQSGLPAPLMPNTSHSWEGIGQGFTGPQGTFSVNSAPPDTNGAVGPNHYVQTTNSDLAVFNKSGTVLYGPVPINTLWAGFGGGCQTNNDGDPVVAYDQFSDRWIVSQFSVSTTPYLQCVAVSTSGDPTGTWNRYSFSFGTSDFNDYPKIGVWSDGYYFTFNIFANGASFSGARVCAYDRAKMLMGMPATAQCFNTSSSEGGLLPANADGPTPPPTGAPNYVVDYGTNALNMWKFHVDWTTPANSTFSGPTSIPVAAFTPMCSGDTCIPQSGTTQQLDTLADRLMYRFAYRNFGDHESLLVNHSVDKGGGVSGIRWYELRNPSGTPTVFQQGTFGPDSTHRWMGSIAMDKQGDIAIGYSASSSSIFPSIRYAGRLVTDPAGQMSQGEATLLAGTGNQGSGLSRWGDYSSMTIDPSDDCTFWYTTEYIATNGTFNWHTRIGSFTFPSCAGMTTNDFSLAASPASVSVAQGSAATYTVSTAVTTGSAQAVSLSASGLPTGATATFNPSSVNAGGSSTLTVATSASTPAGTYTLTITGTGPSATHSATVTLVVNGQTTNNFSIAASPASATVTAGNATSYSITTAVTSGSAQAVSLSSAGVPTGATATFNPTSVTAGGGSTLTVNVGASTAAGTYTITITGTGASATHTATVTLIVQPASSGGGLTNGDFETGTLTGWTTAGSASNSNTAHGGAHSGMVGSTSPTNGDSSIAQTFTVPTGGTTLSFYYNITCPDTITYDWATATLKDNTAGTTATVLAKVCTNNNTWTKVSAAVTAGHSYTLTLISHDDNYTGDATYTLFDDVAIGTTAPPPPLSNGDFETGTLSGWTAAGTTSVSSTAHGGTHSAMIGSTSPTNGDSSIAQTFTAASGVTTLSFWYNMTCPDTLTYDWATATLADTTSGTTTTVLAKVCSNTKTWTQVTANVTAGHSYTLTLVSHDDNYTGDATYTLFDDVSLQ